MNLGIEYLIRTGAAKEALTFPCTLFLEHSYKNINLVVTISFNKFSNRYIVKHWKISDVSKDEILPNFNEYSVSKDNLFTDPSIIVHQYRPLEFKEDSIKVNKQYSLPDYRAKRQEAEYQLYLNNHMNPIANKLNRYFWLWDNFTNAYVPKINDLFPNKRSQLILIEEEFPSYWKRWNKWQDMMYFETPVATELAFYDEFGMNSMSKSKLFYNFYSFNNDYPTYISSYNSF